MGCTTQCLKYILMLFNLVVIVAGIALLGVSIWVLIDSAAFQNIIATKGLSAIFITIWLIFGIGIALFFLGIMGCYGSKHESKCLLALYFFLIFVIFVVEVVAGILSLVFYPEVKNAAVSSTKLYGNSAVNPTIFQNLTQEEQDISNDLTKYWDTFQNTFKCCGFTNYTDWANTTYYNFTEDKFPPSCCNKGTFESIKADVVNQSCTMTDVDTYTSGLSCAARAGNNIMLVGGVALGVLVVEFLSMLASCCMYRSLKDDY